MSSTPVGPAVNRRRSSVELFSGLVWRCRPRYIVRSRAMALTNEGEKKERKQYRYLDVDGLKRRRL